MRTVGTFAAFMAAATALLFTACEQTVVEVVGVNSIDVSPSSPPAISPGSTIQLSATPRSASGEVLQRTFNWSSNNPSVATVSGSGLVTGVSGGTAQITAAADGAIGIAQVQVSNPAPSLNAVTPNSASVGDGDIVIEATGANFVPSSAVRWNGSSRSTVFVDGGRLRATIPASDLSTAGTAQVTVFTPSPGGGTSSPVPFTVQEAVASVQVLPPDHQMGTDWTWFFSARILDRNGQELTGRPIVWSSSNSSVATVDAQGLVTAGASGTTTISATSGGVTGSAPLTITSDPCAPVTVWPPNEQVNATLNANDCNVVGSTRSNFYAFSSADRFAMELTVSGSAFRPGSYWYKSQNRTLTAGIGGLTGAAGQNLANMALLPAGEYQVEVRSEDAVDGSYTGRFDFRGANPEITGERYVYAVAPVDYQGSIATSDWNLGGFFTDRIVMRLAAGETITATYSSSVIDNYLLLIQNSSGSIVAEDDDGGGDFDSRLTYTASSSGLYIFELTTFDTGETGAYRFVVQSNQSAALHASPASVPALPQVRSAPPADAASGDVTTRPRKGSRP